MGNYQDFKEVLLGDPHCILGKNGLTTEFLDHVSSLLKRYKIVKIKALKSIANKTNIKDIAQQITLKTGSHLNDIRGKTFIISKDQIEKKKTSLPS